MASGGQKPKTSASEPRQRSSWQRTTSMSDKEDNISLNSMPNELRPNNWDFSDWRPTSHKDQTKRRKKGNPEWEREQSLSQDSPPPSERQHGTPRTFPRTKITPTTPTSQRVALENLRQHMTFSDQEDGVSNDGERNNDRNLLKRCENLPNYTRQDMSSGSDRQLSRPVPNRREERNNRNNNKQNHNDARPTGGKPDSSQIVGRLMQIRDYIKQASSMMDSLRKSGDPLDSERYIDLSQLVTTWRKQECDCLHTLHSYWPGYREEMDRLQKLMDHLKEQERGYTGLLQSILSVREEVGINDVGRELTPNLEPMDDTQSIDLDVQSETSEVREERSVSASSRPRIEDNLGLTSDQDDDEDEEQVPSDSSERSSNMDDTVISGRKNQDWDFELGEEELALGGVANPKEAAETLVALRQQQELLTKLVEQQEQMRALRGRQAALLALQQDAESKLAVAKQKSNDARAYTNSLEEAATNMTGRAEALLSMETNAGRQNDPDLQDLRQQLQYLRNELKTQNQNIQQAQSTQSNVPASRAEPRTKNQPPPRPPSPRRAEPASTRQIQQPQNDVPPTEMGREQLEAKLTELLGKRDRLDELLQEEMSIPLMPASAAELNRDDLQNKLSELQAKKSRMDDMLQELQTLRTNPLLTLNNASLGPPQASSGAAASQMSEADPVMANTEGTENMANGVLDMLEARQKLQKLNEVKDRLSKMKSLVHYYQSVESGAGRPMDTENPPSLPGYSDFGGETTEAPTQGRRPQSQYINPVQESTKPRVNIPVQPQEESDENNSSSSSDTESQLSSLGPWGDDPEIQEKVRKLKAAKEKLKRLQSLVAMVQHSPDAAGELPDNIAELAASIEDVESQITQNSADRNNQSTSEGEVAQGERDTYYQSKMQEQLDELGQLKDEKERLLTIQSQLQTLHDRFQQSEANRQDDNDEEEDDEDDDEETNLKSQSKSQSNSQQQSSNQQTSGPSVTFSSNEEVYDKMRKQRMLREELRDKKKQLESIMKKDRNKKQYYKNQDNQSDTVSYSTDAFGASASVDATMATWGGSTVDNLESITEDGVAQDNEDDDEDDAYPSDGILQVEEEEEENQSDNETYTIEEDVRQRRKARAAMAKANNTENNMRKSRRSFPRPAGRQGEGTRPKEAWTRPPDMHKWSRNSGPNRKSKQENYRSAEEIVQDDDEHSPKSKSTLEALQKKLEQTSLLCQSLLGDQQAAGQIARQTSTGFGMPDLQQQLQQHQLQMSLNQCYQQIQMQQLEMQTMQRQMQSMLYQMTDNPEMNDSTLSADLRVRSMPSLFSPMLPRQSPNLLMQSDAFPFNPVFQQNMSPASNRLLRRSADESVTAEPVERQRNLSSRLSRQSRSESYAQKTKKKSSSPSQMNNTQGARPKSNTTQTYAEDEVDNSEYPTDRLKFEQYLARKKREFLERNKLSDRAQPKSSDTGQRRSSKTRASGDNQVYRPGLSAGISGAGYQEDGRSVASSVQSSVAIMAQALNSQTENREVRESDDPNEMSLFETLRETIYSEVATLISQNENRPHYLIELFRELQLLTTDYLRQRVLYDIKDVVSKYLVEENSVSAPPPPWMNTAVGNFTASELTPSESLVTSDDEEVRNKLKEKVAANLVAKERNRAAQMLLSGSMKNDTYDYQEVADVASSVSTPSNSYWESPFNQDSLGETAIHLDKTLERMREYEKRLATKDARVKAVSDTRQAAEAGDVCSSMDQGSQSSVNSDSVPYPRIDTQQLDQQIKSIMTEVIPVIKEHMDNMCSPQLLAYIKRLVLSLTRQYDSGQEFARFFHRQLGSILQDTLAKYEGRKMRECGEDLLVDMSEVLFNELAFFRLMQDLDDPLIAEKMQKAQVWSDSEEEEDEDKDKEESDEEDEESDTTESSTANASDNQDETRATQTEEEDLGKARDDEFANEIEIQDAEEKDEDPESPFKIELAPSETKPYTRIGSDEDDESADDESLSNEDPSETAVSINARRVNYTDDIEDDATRQDGTVEAGVAEGSDSKQGQVSSVQQGDQGSKDADQGASNGKVESQSSEHMNGDLILNGDIEVITMDDLPASLTVMSQEDLQQKVSQEQLNNSGAAVVLDTIDGQDELAGDPQHLKEPDEASG